MLYLKAKSFNYQLYQLIKLKVKEVLWGLFYIILTTNITC
jgi:hypothetical protein